MEATPTLPALRAAILSRHAISEQPWWISVSRPHDQPCSVPRTRLEWTPIIERSCCQTPCIRDFRLQLHCAAKHYRTASPTSVRPRKSSRQFDQALGAWFEATVAAPSGWPRTRYRALACLLSLTEGMGTNAPRLPWGLSATLARPEAKSCTLLISPPLRYALGFSQTARWYQLFGQC